MSAPPGWHQQPDGRERWWDGTQWTEHVRDAATGYPPPPPPAGSVPTVTTPVAGNPYGGPAGAPGWQPPRQGMSSTAKGCLIAAAVGLVLLLVGGVVAVVLFARTVDRTVQDIGSAFPSGLPTATGPATTVSVGDGFEVGGVQVADGWTIGDNGGIGKTVQGMRATTSDGREVFLTLSFATTDGGTVDTVCTGGDQTGGEVEVTCIPLFGAVDEEAPVEVRSTF